MSLLKLSFFTFLTLPLSLYAKSGWKSVYADPSVIKLESRNGTCTGTFISDNGHILTARHCIHACLISQDFVQETQIFPEYGWQSPSLFQQNRLATCSLKLNGEETKVTVLSSGPGFMTPSEQASLSFYDRKVHKDFLEQGFLHNGDYALLKIESLPKNYSCRSVAHQPTQAGSFVQYLGYPKTSAGRPKNRNSDGYNLMHAQGEVISSISQNSCINTNEAQMEQLSLIYDRPEIILSTVDLLPGASGSSLINEEGHIVGLVNSMYRKGLDVENTYCAGSAVAIHIAEILRGIERFSFGPIDNFTHCREAQIHNATRQTALPNSTQSASVF